MMEDALSFLFAMINPFCQDLRISWIKSNPQNWTWCFPIQQKIRDNLNGFQLEKEDKASELEHLRDKLEKNQLLIARLQEEKETAHRESERLLEKYDRSVGEHVDRKRPRT